MKLYRLDRLLSNRGVGSRAEVARLIRRNQIVIDDKVVKCFSQKYPFNVKVLVNCREVEIIPLVAVFNKPYGMLSTVGDPLNRKNLNVLYNENNVIKNMHTVVSDI